MSVYWVGDVFVLSACLAAFTRHGTPPLAALILAYATGYALSRRTLPFAGAGAVEALLPFALESPSHRPSSRSSPTASSTCGSPSSPEPGLLVLKRRPVGTG
jgi:hypothetical protein